MTSLRVNEVYDRATIQGEGPHAGRLCTFVRLYGCNLHCTWCDTPYTWDITGRNGVVFPAEQESQRMSIEEVAVAVVELNVPICVITGGEPLLQATGVELLARLLAQHGVATHLETNGTRLPHTPAVFEHITVSPKLPSAGAGPLDRVLNFDVLRHFAQMSNVAFKVVCGNVSDVELAFELFETIDAPASHRWVMPEGVTGYDVASSLRAITDLAIKRGMNVSSRLHVMVWGTERGR